MKRVVDAALCCRGKMLLCLEQVSHFPGELYWVPPSGKPEVGESCPVAIFRELGEELGINKKWFDRCGITLRPYCGHWGVWGGDQIVVWHFIADFGESEPPSFKLLVGQKAAVLTSTPPAGGLLSEFTEALMITLRLGGYLRP